MSFGDYALMSFVLGAVDGAVNFALGVEWSLNVNLTSKLVRRKSVGWAACLCPSTRNLIAENLPTLFSPVNFVLHVLRGRFYAERHASMTHALQTLLLQPEQIFWRRSSVATCRCTCARFRTDAPPTSRLRAQKTRHAV